MEERENFITKKIYYKIKLATFAINQYYNRHVIKNN